ncbi:ribosome recycling factor [Candidatus Falkowbacteria bacterium]|nr:ribosome recycling factor [Candidatus Falkowbacteria bacterium]
MNQFIAKHQANFDAVVEHFKKEIGGIRTGRATPSLVENVQVNAYGVRTPLKQLASISIAEVRMLNVEAWDKTVIKDIEKAIAEANVGVTTAADGNVIHVSVPQMTEETRDKYLKILKEKLEKAKISLRSVREKVKDEILAAFKVKEISEDSRYNFIDELDKETAKYTAKLEEQSAIKEKEIKTI